MKFDTQSFPYPVLTPIDQGDDYIDGSFECVVSFPENVNDDGTFSVSYINMLSVIEIQELIDTVNDGTVSDIDEEVRKRIQSIDYISKQKRGTRTYS